MCEHTFTSEHAHCQEVSRIARDRHHDQWRGPYALRYNEWIFAGVVSGPRGVTPWIGLRCVVGMETMLSRGPRRTGMAALDGRSVLVTARERYENTCVNRCTLRQTSFNRCRRLRDDSAAGVMARLHNDLRQKVPDCTHVLCSVVGRRILPGRSCFCRHPRCGYELGMDGRRFGMLGFVPRQIVRRIPVQVATVWRGDSGAGLRVFRGAPCSNMLQLSRCRGLSREVFGASWWQRERARKSSPSLNRMAVEDVGVVLHGDGSSHFHSTSVLFDTG